MYKYSIIANDIKQKIEDNIYKVNDKLPDEITLSRDYSCSRMTIKRAIDILVNEGFITKSRGAGTFVRPQQKINENKHYYSNHPSTFGFYNTFKNYSYHTEIKNFKVIEASSLISSKLQLKLNEFVYFIERVRYIDGIPIIFETSYLPVDKIPGLTKDVLEDSLYNFIEKKLNIKIFNADKFIRAILPTENDFNYLKATNSTPILEVEHIIYSNKNIPLEFAIVHYHSSYYELHFITKKE